MCWRGGQTGGSTYKQVTVNLKKYYQVHNVPEGKQNTCGFQVRVFARTGATAVKLASFYAM